MICKYVDRKGSDAMLATKRSAGVTLHPGDKACKQGIEIQGKHHQKSKTTVSVGAQKGLLKASSLRYRTYLNGTNFIILATLIVHNGHVVVTDMQFLLSTFWIRILLWHQSSNMVYGCNGINV